MGTAEWISLTTLILAILGIVVGVTRYITQLHGKLGVAQLEERFERLKEQNADIAEKHERLLQEIAIAKRVGTAAIIKKSGIDDEVLDAQITLQARASSILIVRPTIGTSRVTKNSNLVFLTLHGPAAHDLKRTPVPMDSIAGTVFMTGTPYIASNAHEDPNYYVQVEKLSKYRIQDIIAYPLKHEGKIVGVVQIMNKLNKGSLGMDDLDLLKTFVPSLSAKVADFIYNPENLEILGITLEREAEDATVIFCDLTDSSMLFNTMNAASATDRVNEYLEGICDVGLSYGAIIDTYVGDGVMLKFNIPRRVIEHPMKGLQAAINIQTTFQGLKDRWIKAGYPVSGVYSRVGVSCGLVHEAIIGHPQHPHPTIMGKPVHIANGLCDGAIRGKNIISIDHSIYERLSDRLIVEEISSKYIGKAGKMTEKAYELIGIKN